MELVAIPGPAEIGAGAAGAAEAGAETATP